jgi:signal recognition particle subunit SEC65
LSVSTETLAEVVASAGIVCIHERENPGQQTREDLGNVT